MTPVTVVPPGSLDRAILDIPGAFLWWYVDLVDDLGRGVVLIASWGLPFLPGLLSASRQGAPIAPRERPALSIAVYGDSGFYLLDVPEDAAWESQGSGEHLRLGRTTVTLRWDGDTFTLEALIDAEGAGEPITGALRVTGTSRPSRSPLVEHGWSLLVGGAEGTATLRFGGETVEIRGRAYVDRNAGTKPIDQLGMSAWTWARVALPDGDLVIWDVGDDQQALAIWAGTDGGRRVCEPRYTREGRLWAGGTLAPRQIIVNDDGAATTLSFGPAYEASPFYARFPVTCTDAEGRVSHGLAERCLPGRIDRAWMRPFVRMCVQEPARRSPWLPLFAGPRDGRVRRLLRSWATS